MFEGLPRFPAKTQTPGSHVSFAFTDAMSVDVLASMLPFLAVHEGRSMTVALHELAMQGDPGTLASEDQASKLKLLTPQQL